MPSCSFDILSFSFWFELIAEIKSKNLLIDYNQYCADAK